MTKVAFFQKTPYRFEKTSSQVIEKLLLDKQEELTRQRCPLLCRSCKGLVTYVEAEIEVAGSVRHKCVNPAGISYLLACYEMAPGCTAVSRPTQEHTWFVGYVWQIAGCSSCGGHLGWCFQSSDFQSENREFYGLIENQLIPGEPEHP